MFGCCVAGRLLQTKLVQVDETHAYFELPAASAINHICVFLLGTVPFPDGYGASVHFFLPGKGFQLLGMLSNDKPSAIFRLRGTFTQSSASPSAHAAFSSTSFGPDSSAILGLAIEPLSSIAQSLPSSAMSATGPAPSTAVTKAPDPTALAERVVKHLFNYISGFASGGAVTPETAVPMRVIAKWYETFMAKVKAGGVGFLENVE